MKRIAAAFIVVFGIHFIWKWNTRNSAYIINGLIVDVETTTLSGASRGGRISSTYFDYPIVQYTIDGIERTSRKVTGAVYTKSARVGDSVRIVVPAKDLSNALPDTFWCYWLRLPKAILLFFFATLLAALFFKLGEQLREMNNPET